MRHNATVQSNLPALIEAKAKQRGEAITLAEITIETRLAPGTVGMWMHSKLSRFDGHVIAALCKYLDCGVEDLLKIVDVEQSSDEENQTPLQ